LALMMETPPIKIDKEGRWFYQGEEITHRRTYLLFCRSLTRDESGRILLRVGREECPVEVEDVPFVVATMEFVSPGPIGREAIWLTLNDETREKIDPETLRIGPDHVPYCQVRDGMFEARFSRNAYQILSPPHPVRRKRNLFLPLPGRWKALPLIRFWLLVAGSWFEIPCNAGNERRATSNDQLSYFFGE
jgi:hypothetical protein